jgi:hypothetical protein
LILKDKVAALVYADSGTGEAGLLDGGSLELLVLSTGAWLEVNSLRKQAHKEQSAAHVDRRNVDNVVPPVEAPPYQAPAFNDPFAPHALGYAMAAAAAAGEASAPVAGAAADSPMGAGSESQTVIAEGMIAEGVTAEAQSASAEVQSAVVEMDPTLAEPLPIGYAETVATAETPPVASISLEDQDVHRKAQRFARLLVDEIKLYNQAKVAEGRKNKDLYDRLTEAIEKSRATYQRRYGSTVAAPGNYFQHEIIRSLAEDDLSIMGANFRQ